MRLPWPLPDSSFRRFRLLNSYAAAKKGSAAPHRGEANRPKAKQGKANTVGKQRNQGAAGKPPTGNEKPEKPQRHRQNHQSAAQAKKSSKRIDQPHSPPTGNTSDAAIALRIPAGGEPITRGGPTLTRPVGRLPLLPSLLGKSVGDTSTPQPN